MNQAWGIEMRWNRERRKAGMPMMVAIGKNSSVGTEGLGGVLPQYWRCLNVQAYGKEATLVEDLGGPILWQLPMTRSLSALARPGQR
jgi:hypothetical protein